MPNTLTWHGHSAFQIHTADAEIIIDPFLDGNPKAKLKADQIPKPDLVLLTHDHGDHTGQTVELAQAGAKVGCIVGTAQALVDRGAPAGCLLNGIGFNIGGTLEFKGVKITMTQAFHSSDSGFPVGYILTLPDGFTIYHAGDTGIFADMGTWGQLYPIDLALLPIGGVFTMDPRQAALACELLQTKAVIPMHWGTFPVLGQSAQALGQALDARGLRTKLAALNPGDTVTLDETLTT